MNKRLKIQYANMSDFNGIKRLTIKSFLRLYPELETKDWIFQRIKQKLYYVIKDDTKIIGLMSLNNDNPDALHIETLAIEHKYRKQGLGTLFIQKAITKAKRINTRKTTNSIIKKITVLSSNIYRVKDFYLKNGFKIVSNSVIGGRPCRYFKLPIDN